MKRREDSIQICSCWVSVFKRKHRCLKQRNHVHFQLKAQSVWLTTNFKGFHFCLDFVQLHVTIQEVENTDNSIYLRWEKDDFVVGCHTEGCNL